MARKERVHSDVRLVVADVDGTLASCTIPPAQIATIGDMPNDVLMFKRSGVSIAMGNATA